MRAAVKAKGGAESATRFSFESVNRDITIPSTANSYDDIAFVGDIQTEMDEPEVAEALRALGLA